ncbi:MAG: ribonuclease HII [Gammaproteobacteria bacterium]|nr:MAG: ribonuclease HII [Gammaproteobacteria bacterium]
MTTRNSPMPKSEIEPDPTRSQVLEAGVDEAGRGPLAGPVVVAAVILPMIYELKSLDDSKRLTALQRENLVPQIKAQAIAFAVEFVAAEEIDRVNILQATMHGMQRAVEHLLPAPTRVWIDGNRAPQLSCEVKTVIGGDRLIASISAASILAKVYRDRLMLDLHHQYPGYGFDRHKGYPTAHHLERLQALGPCAIHRQSFAPVRRALH